jgi:hypothetical protein
MEDSVQACVAHVLADPSCCGMASNHHLQLANGNRRQYTALRAERE